MSTTVLWMQKPDPEDPDIEYSAQDFRQLIDATFAEGVLDLDVDSLLVGPRGAGANLSVDVEAGRAVIVGDDENNQGSYLVVSPEVVNVTGFDAAPGSNSRIDLVCLQVKDPQAGGGAGSTAEFVIVTGTPGASPSAPAVPDSAIVLAEVLLTVGDVSIGGGGGSSGVITDARSLIARPTFGSGTPADGDLLVFDEDSGSYVPLAPPTPPLGGLLAYVQYNPASDYEQTTSSTTFVDVNASDLAVTFTVPASGKVLVRLDAMAYAGADRYFWGLRESSSVVGLGQAAMLAGGAGFARVTTEHVITGLTPDASKTYKWAHRVKTTGPGALGAGTGASTEHGPAIMTVWAAP